VNPGVALGVKCVADKLNDLELATLNNFVNGFGYMPSYHPLFPQVRHLFTGPGYTAHDDVKDALAAIVLERLNQTPYKH